jgi:hypothetical protein
MKPREGNNRESCDDTLLAFVALATQSLAPGDGFTRAVMDAVGVDRLRRLGREDARRDDDASR